MKKHKKSCVSLKDKTSKRWNSLIKFVKLQSNNADRPSQMNRVLIENLDRLKRRREDWSKSTVKNNNVEKALKTHCSKLRES